MQRTARLAILGIALFAGLLAAFLVARTPAPEKPVIVQQAPARANTIDVLIAVGDLGIGTVVKPEQLDWRAWPAESNSPHLIRRSDKPEAKAEYANAIVRVGLIDGEPIRAEKLIKPDGSSGFMSAILPTGMRALAVSIDRTGSTNAGGFILPEDRVDVIRTTRHEAAGRGGGGGSGPDQFHSETILSNIRVLAIGQKVEQGSDGQKYVIGDTATLELNGEQAEIMAQAQKQGSISLALRSMVDRKETPGSQSREGGNSMTIVRFGVSYLPGK